MDAHPALQLTDTVVTSEVVTPPRPFTTQQVWFDGCDATATA
jgi:hypothetical protein